MTRVSTSHSRDSKFITINLLLSVPKSASLQTHTSDAVQENSRTGLDWVVVESDNVCLVRGESMPSTKIFAFLQLKWLAHIPNKLSERASKCNWIILKSAKIERFRNRLSDIEANFLTSNFD